MTRKTFRQNIGDPPSSRIKPISWGSYDRLKEFYVPVRTDCWPRGLRKGATRKRHTTERLYFRISHMPSVPRDLSRFLPSAFGDFIYTEGCVALLKPFPDNTSAPLRSRACSRYSFVQSALCMCVSTRAYV